jgi:hypothetical protein
MKKKGKITKKKKIGNMIKNISLIFLSLMIFSSILLGNFNTSDKEKAKSINESDFENQNVLSSSSQIIWTQTLDGPSDDQGSSIWGDGTYLYTIGNTRSFGAGETDLILIKWNSDGNQLWNTTWGGVDFDFGNSIWGDGTYLYTTGNTESFGTGERDLFLVKWDTDGNQIWNTTWGGMQDDQGQSVWGDGTYLYTTGYSQIFSLWTTDLIIIKWDSNGNQLWNTTWGGTDDDGGNSIWGDGTYLYTTGFTYSFGVGDADLLIAKWDTDGNQIWYQTWSGMDNDSGMSIWGDGTYLYITGITRSSAAGDHNLILIKWDLDGNQIWIQIWDDIYDDLGYSIWGDGTYLYTTGMTYSSSTNDDLLVVKWDLDGNQIWNQTCDDNNNIDWGISIWGDDIYIYAFGYTQTFTNEFALFFVKMSKDVLQNPDLQSIFPNPNLDGNISLNWNSVTNATSYSLYRSIRNITDVSGLSPISTSVSTSYTDIDLLNGTYYYAVVAINGSRESDISNCESVEVQIPPPEPKENEISGFLVEFITPIGVISIVLLILKKRK